MFLRAEADDAGFVDVAVAHLQVLGNLAVLIPRDETQLVLPEIDGDGIRIETVVRLAAEFQQRTDFQLFEGFRPVPIAESGDVEVGQVPFVLHFYFVCQLFRNNFLFHNANILNSAAKLHAIS